MEVWCEGKSKGESQDKGSCGSEMGDGGESSVFDLLNLPSGLVPCVFFGLQTNA